VRISDTYADYVDDIAWLRARLQKESSAHPQEIKSLAQYYLRKRLPILLDRSTLRTHYWRFKDPRLEKPSPYAPFWFADAFRLTDKEIIRKLVLGYLYITLAVSIKDDLMDNKVGSGPEHICLANLYLDKYFDIFRNIFPPESKFWYTFSNWMNEWGCTESWRFLFRPTAHDFDPLSDRFLAQSSKYLVCITMPTLAAIALLTKNGSIIPRIAKFARHYCSAFRIQDDLRDWRNDLKVPNFNHSSVLYYVFRKLGAGFRGKLSENQVLSVFLDQEAITDIYGAVLRCLNRTRDDALVFHSSYIARFVDEQISLYTDERDALFRSRVEFYDGLKRMLSRERNAIQRHVAVSS